MRLIFVPYDEYKKLLTTLISPITVQGGWRIRIANENHAGESVFYVYTHVYSPPVTIGPGSPIATGRELSNWTRGGRGVQKLEESIRDVTPKVSL